MKFLTIFRIFATRNVKCSRLLSLNPTRQLLSTLFSHQLETETLILTKEGVISNLPKKLYGSENTAKEIYSEYPSIRKTRIGLLM